MESVNVSNMHLQNYSSQWSFNFLLGSKVLTHPSSKYHIHYKENVELNQ
jgi:hypothetical protein